MGEGKDILSLKVHFSPSGTSQDEINADIGLSEILGITAPDLPGARFLAYWFLIEYYVMAILIQGRVAMVIAECC